MTDHLEPVHSDLLEAVSRAAQTFQQSVASRYGALESELRQGFLEREKEQTSLIESLKAENHELRSRLAQGAYSPNASASERLRTRPAGATSSPTPSNTLPPPATLHGFGAETDWQAAYLKLHAKFLALEGNFKKAREALERRRSERDQWAGQIALLQDRLSALQDKRVLPGSPDQQGLPASLSSIAASRPSNAAGAAHAASEASAAHDQPSRRANPDTERRHGSVVSKRPTPGSTQSEPEEGPEVALPSLPIDSDGVLAPIIKQEPSSDSPVVVSERPVRKRKRVQSGNGTSPTRVKVEPAPDSSPAPLLERFVVHSEDNLDLGEVGQRIATPRKPREPALSNGSRSALVTEPPLPVSFSRAEPELYAKATPKAVRPAPLSPIDANRRLKRAGVKSADPAHRREDNGKGIGVLAEDGASYGLRPHSSRGLVDNPAPKNRVDDLLNTPGNSDPKPDIYRPSARKISKPSTPRNDLMMPKPRSLPFERSVRSGVKQQVAEEPRQLALVGASSLPPKRRETVREQSKGGLRNRPVSELKLDDFKINPRANEGVDYAFSDVVRDKTERAALPGCTDPHCCGEEFRALAMSQRPNPPLNSEQRREEQKLLEDYLGDHAYKLAAMDKRERAEMWVDAKTHELANKYGKHRHRYSRMRSPPGFWNADFPSTQELETEKVEAAKRERRSIEERHREAMRPGGRWVFRDE